MSSTVGFRVATGASEAEHRVGGSRFVAVAGPARDLDEASAARETQRRRFHDATHHVFAAVLRDGLHRYDDDGEPSGTAGRPVLVAIERAGLVDAVVVVTRYFGGTKLGTGGLARAYGAAADLALGRIPIRSVVQGRRVVLSFSYADTGAANRAVEAAGAVRLDERYGERAELEVAVPESRLGRLRADVTETTAGRVEIVEIPGEILLPADT